MALTSVRNIIDVFGGDQVNVAQWNEFRFFDVSQVRLEDEDGGVALDVWESLAPTLIQPLMIYSTGVPLVW